MLMLPDNLTQTISLQARYALMRASINSLASNTPPELLRSAVEQGIWPPVQALSVIRQNTDPKGQTAALEAVVPLLPEILLPSVLSIIEALQADGDRYTALLNTSPHLPDSLLPRALTIARSMQDN